MAKPLIDAVQLERLAAVMRDMSDDVKDLVASLMEDIANQVVRDARQNVPSLTGRARASYKAAGHELTIGDGVPYVPWLEFGGKVGRNKSNLRAYNPRGRYLYPAIARNMAHVEKQVDDLIEQASHGFLEIEGG